MNTLQQYPTLPPGFVLVTEGEILPGDVIQYDGAKGFEECFGLIGTRIDLLTGSKVYRKAQATTQKQIHIEALHEERALLFEKLADRAAALAAIDKLTCNVPLMTQDVQRHFERATLNVEAYRQQLNALILQVREIARSGKAPEVEQVKPESGVGK